MNAAVVALEVLTALERGRAVLGRTRVDLHRLAARSLELTLELPGRVGATSADDGAGRGARDGEGAVFEPGGLGFAVPGED